MRKTLTRLALAGTATTLLAGAALAQVKQAASQVFSASTPIDNERDAHKSLRALQDGARPLCGWWLKQKASDIRALRLARTLLWLPIDSLPERNAEQVTALRGLPPDKLASYRERFAAGQYADLLLELESPDLDSRQAIVRREIDILQLQLKRQAGRSETAADSAILEQNLAAAVAEYLAEGKAIGSRPSP